VNSSASNLVSVLSEQEIAEIRELAAHYDYPQAASIEALKVVQKYRGWISDQSLVAIARELQMSAEELDSVATFYSLIFRSPVGDNLLMLCDGISCWMAGCDQLKRKITDTLGIDYGETTGDKRYTLIPVTCQGACDRAPVMLKNWELHTRLTEDSVTALLRDDKTTPLEKTAPQLNGDAAPQLNRDEEDSRS